MHFGFQMKKIEYANQNKACGNPSSCFPFKLLFPLCLSWMSSCLDWAPPCCLPVRLPVPQSTTSRNTNFPTSSSWPKAPGKLWPTMERGTEAFYLFFIHLYRLNSFHNLPHLVGFCPPSLSTSRTAPYFAPLLPPLLSSCPNTHGHRATVYNTPELVLPRPPAGLPFLPLEPDYWQTHPLVWLLVKSWLKPCTQVCNFSLVPISPLRLLQ